MKNSLISIVLPTYNRAHFIGETIGSIQAQTYSNWELIIEDDGSTDETEAIVRNVDDKRIQYYKEEHKGMESMRSKGLQRSKGYFVCFIDSDDLWHPEKLEKQLHAFDDFPEASFCMTGGYDFRTKNSPHHFFYQKQEGQLFGDLFTPFFQSGLAAMLQTLMLKRERLNQINFKENIELAHIYFMLDLALNFKGVLLYEPLFFRRLHENNFSSQSRKQRHADGLQLIKSYKRQIPSQVFENCMYKAHLNFGEDCLNHSEKRIAQKEFFKAWKQRPLSLLPLKKILKTLMASK